MSQEFVLIAAAVVGVLSTGRLTRLITEDGWPPAAWFRTKWDAKFEKGGWGVLVHCPWCAAPYFAAVVMAWGWLSNLHWSWWAFNGWLALSYAGSWVNFHDSDGFSDR